MKCVLQRVLSASVTVEGQKISSINQGLLLLIGIMTGDTLDDAHKLASKILRLKLWNSSPEDKPWQRSIVDIQGQILCVSQFTLGATTKKGAKPDFHKSMKGPEARPLYEAVLEELRKGLGEVKREENGEGGVRRGFELKVQDGAFGEMMEVGLVNDGPVTILLDTKEEI
ncbi:D-tyrosyl-tRNA deacylase [Saitoella complicata NRRL Y-17804]|uniref:D-tyrosyl-tRNA deacylase n=1 Tax=Saitoella complicata (strain BCRC 22490 / CBS 7301 / JCM 7358 / NBRC 10748 / NRRL Y-17804) TaxID=698492 RepID=UPI0008682051|nr:D-tyrosyl-tRNA deacylase [Saitoella complicata NRRL Y-17804]ODQ50309.1 D-tyrosyl-tRNA deacylase [Saitoella complicata NRRL Y-17804]